MNAVMQCTHPSLHAETRAIVFGKKQSSGNFIVCSNPNCKAVIAYVPSAPRVAQEKPKVNPLQGTLKLKDEEIARLKSDLSKCRNGVA